MQPNIVFLHSHNTGSHIQPYGHAIPTPHIQRLAEQGVVLRKGFCVSPTCSPSRASFMTGQWPHVCGMFGLAHRGFKLHDYNKTLIRTLNAAGYETVLAGLQHIAPKRDMLGYSLDLSPEPKWQGHTVAPRAVEYLRQYAATATAHRPLPTAHSAPLTAHRPFFLDVGINETHRGYPDPVAYGIDARYMRGPGNLPDTPETRLDAAGLAASCRDMDNAFGQVLDALDAAGLADNTFVICLSDHGLQWPGGMCNLTDGGLETFLILRGPNGFTGGKVLDPMVTHIDLFPTICDLAGIETPEWVMGKSLVPLMQGKTDRVHDAIFGEITYHAAYEPQRCIRTERYKYIRRYLDRSKPVLPNIDRCPSREMLLTHGLADQPRDREALYDLIFDPQEAHNLIDDPKHATVATDLRQRLDHWMQDTHDPLLNGPVPAPAGAQVNHPDGLHPADRVETMP